MTDLSSRIGGSPFTPGMAEPGGFFGPYRGIVTNTTDPVGQNRVKAVVPQLFGNASTETDWALPCVPANFAAIPQPGQGVWIMFEGGDINYPVWMGVWQGTTSTPSPYDPVGAAAACQAASDPLGTADQAAAQAIATSEAYTNAQFNAYYPSLVSVSGHLAGGYNLTNSLATFMTTGSLTVGTWLVNMSAECYCANSGTVTEVTTAQGTATATFEGCYSTTISDEQVASTTTTVPAVLTFVATVTVAGTLVFRAKTSITTNFPAIDSTTRSTGYANATGYTAVRISS